MNRWFFHGIFDLIKILAQSKKFPPLIVSFSRFFFAYAKHKIMAVSLFFEKQKNILVKFFMMKRGRYNRPFLHASTMGVLGFGVIVAPFLADRYPIFSSNQSSVVSLAQASEQSITVGDDVFKTNISQKPRDKIISYTVQKGDTISTIGKKFGISEETIRWENDLKGDNITVGDELRIPPVSGVVHKVVKGDTVYTIAKHYDTDAQQIVDFPFNEFANPQTFTLVEGQTLIIPNGVKPSEKPTVRRVYVTTGPVGSISSAGFTWPLRGGISQFAAWYHMGIDITASVGAPIATAHNGKVTQVLAGTWDGGYGTNVWIDNGAGFVSHYAHMSGVNVSVGDEVVAGRTVIGWVGLTGRTTGPHLHFEILRGGVLVDPLPYLQ